MCCLIHEGRRMPSRWGKKEVKCSRHPRYVSNQEKV